VVFLTVLVKEEGGMVIVVFVPALLREHLEVERRGGGGGGRGGRGRGGSRDGRGVGVRVVLVDKAVWEQRKEGEEKSKGRRQEVKEKARERGREGSSYSAGLT